MLKALPSYGIAIYIVSLLIHRYLGANDVAFWVALYHLLQNLGLSLVCAGLLFNRSKYKLINSIGLCYFSSAFVFYVYAFVTNQHIYFSNCGAAGKVLSYLIAIAIILTIIDAYANRRRR